MADNNIKNLNNPLLSANITGFSIEDFTQNPVLLPVPPKPVLVQREQSVTAQNLNEEQFSEISLDSDNQDNAPISTQEETKSPLLDLDSTNDSPIQPARPSSTNSNSAFSQVTNQASQLSAQLSQLPSVASSVLSSFSNILGRGSGSPANNQPKQPDAYKSPLDNLGVDSGNQQSPVPLLSANPSALTGIDQNRPPSTSGVVPPPVPLFPPGQCSQSNNQKPPPVGNTFRLGGIKKKTYAQIPGLNTSHVQQLVDAPLQSNSVLPNSSQSLPTNFLNPDTIPSSSVPSPGAFSQSSEVASVQPANFFQPSQYISSPTDNNQLEALQTSQKFPDIPKVQQEQAITNPSFYAPPSSTNQSQSFTLNTGLPPPPISSIPQTTPVSSFFNPTPQSTYASKIVPTQTIPSQYEPPLSLNQNTYNSFSSPIPFISSAAHKENSPIPSSISHFQSPNNLQHTDASQQQLTCNLPKSNYPQAGSYSSTSNVTVFNPALAANTCTTSEVPNISSAPPNILPPPPTKSSLNAKIDSNLPSNTQTSIPGRNPFSIHSISKNRAPPSIPTADSIAFFNPNLVKHETELKNSQKVSINTSELYNISAHNAPIVVSAREYCPGSKVESSSVRPVENAPPVSDVAPFLTVSPESEQSVLRSLAPVNTTKPPVSSFFPPTSKEQVINAVNLVQNPPQSQDNSRKSSYQESQSASSYFNQAADINKFNDVSNKNAVTSNNHAAPTIPQSFFNIASNVNSTNVTNQQPHYTAGQQPPVPKPNITQSCRITSVPPIRTTAFASTSFGNMENTPPTEAPVYEPVTHHWFHKREVDSKVIWTPFSQIDSAALEKAFLSGSRNVTVATDGGRYDVNVTERTRSPVYWPGEVTNVRRCSWFFKAIDSRFMPYEENIADLLEAEYRNCTELNSWHRRIELPYDESVMLHGPTVLVHFLRSAEPQDTWTNGAQTANRPRIVKRGVLDFELDKGEPTKVDHLLFLVHGIGSVCDLKFRTVEEVVDEFRGISLQLVQSHYRSACESGLVNRIEVLPVSWHGSLHSSETGIDDKLKAITLESIPKLREFTNGTLLDVLFYTSPVFCQTIMQTVGNELNRLYSLFLQRNPGYNGGVSLGGHSLGSLILFDLLCHQTPPEESVKENHSTDSEMESHEDDKVAPLNERKPLKRALSKRINYVIGHAGTGQPFIKYPQLSFHPNTFFALGSPLGMFVTIRGIDTLGLDFSLPTCPGFFNIFHPYDPVAYRVEALINPSLKNVRPVLIPHHKGRKRMHLELKETMSRVGADLKNRLMDSVKNTWNSVYQIAMFKGTQTLDDVVDKALRQELQMKYSSTSSLDSDGENKADENLDETSLPLGKLNQGRRVDYVLQEAPLEFFNEYIFALTSHVCYWESEDTMLIIIKEIYSSLGATTDSQIPQQTMTIERPVYVQNDVVQQQNPVESCSTSFSPRQEMSSAGFSK